MGKPGRPAKKRGLLAKKKRVTHRRTFSAFDKGVVVGRLIAAKNAGTVFNAAEIGRDKNGDNKGGTWVNRSAICNVVKKYKAGTLMPPTQPHAAPPGTPLTEKAKKIQKRRKLAASNALKRTRAEDDTERPLYETQRDIRESLPAALRPSSDTTIGRDLRAEGVYWLSTARTPCLGPEWRKLRLAYCTATPKLFPASKYAHLMLASDESLFNVNNGHSRKEYRRRKMRPMQVKTRKYPASVMVWVVVGKHYRTIVVHAPEGDDDDDAAAIFKTKKEMVEKEKIQLKHGVSATKRYTMRELEDLTTPAQIQWMDLERRFNLNRKSKGVNRFAHCHQCLEKVKKDLNGADHVILEDNAKIHTSCYTRLYRKHLNLKYIPGHPADSADLNPCEHAFSWVKKRVSFRGAPTKARLIKAIEEEFKKIPQKTMDNWIDSYWTRMAACKKAKGDWVGEHECRRPGKRKR